MKYYLLCLSTLALVAPPAFCADLTAENIPATEAADIRTIESIIEHTVRKQAGNDGVAHRDAHAKHHGCVQGTFTVDAGLAPELKVGVFAEPRSYPAWIRFSNGDGGIRHDKEGDGRGLAIKLMGVTGSKILEGEEDEKTQDFVMINHPIFFIRNVADYVPFSKATADGGNPVFKYFLNPFDPHLYEFRKVLALTSKKVFDPSQLAYYSMTPYRLSDRAIKFQARPCRLDPNVSKLSRKSFNYLREALVKRLSNEDLCFDFLVQLRTDADAMPLEDPTVEWSEKLSPYRHVARVRVPKQVFDTPERNEFCENLSFTPWHALPEHRPLGGINRVRKVVYQTVSKLRHELNGVERKEPEARP